MNENYLGPRARNYLPELAEIQASEAEKIELIEVLYSFLKSCIAMQLDEDNFGQLIDAIENASRDSTDTLACSDQQPEEC